MDALFEQVLERLGFPERPKVSLEGLSSLYAERCQRVPFDNVRKLIHVSSGSQEPFPGHTAEDFFTAWLRHGTGGTCWSGAGALQSLLSWLGMAAERGIATMLAAPDLPPNHGTVRVTFGDAFYLVDTAILHGQPLRLTADGPESIHHPAWGVQGVRRNGQDHLAWRPLHKTDGFECRLESFGATQTEYAERYERTRGWSPFNYALCARLNRGEMVQGTAFGQAISLLTDGTVWQEPIDDAGRRRLLVEKLGFSEEITAQLPVDQPTPAPPGSRTAAVS